MSTNISIISSEVFTMNSSSLGVNVTDEVLHDNEENTGALLKTLSNLILPITLCVIMLGMGSTIEFRKLLDNLRPPVGPAIGMMSQFLVLPLSMFGLAHLLQLDPYAAVGMIVLASSPGGSTSNLFSYWADGDVPLSLTMTTLSTILALGLMPLNIWVYSRSWVSDELTVPYVNIFISLFMIVVPASIGILARWKFPNIADKLVKIGSASGVLAVAATMTLTSLRYPYMYSSSWQVYTGALLQPFVGFAFGYTLAKLFRLSDCQARTVSLETGIQNFPLCMTVISLSFPSHVISKLGLIPLLSSVTLITNSCTFLAIYKIVKRLRPEVKPAYSLTKVDVGKEEDIELTVKTQ